MDCIICGQQATSGQQGSIGDQSGPVCADCAYWCDGNLTAQ